MSDELSGLARYIDALTDPIAIDEVSRRPRRSRPPRALAFAVAAVVVAGASIVAVVAVGDRGGEHAHTPPSGVQVVPSTTSEATTTTSIATAGDATITSAPIAPAWVNDISASDAGVRVTGQSSADGAMCSSAAVDPQTLGLSQATEAKCVDPASAGEVVAPVDAPITGTNNATLSIAHLDPTTHAAVTGPVVMTYGSYSDTRPITAYGGDWLWIYDVETIPNGPEVLQVSRSTGEVVNTLEMPTLYRPLLAANDDGLWVGESVQGGQCDGCGPPPALTFVGAGARAAVTVPATGSATTFWLRAVDHQVWASVGSFTHRNVVRFDGTDLHPAFQVPESDLNVFSVSGDGAAGLWSVAPESPTAPLGTIVRYDVVRIDPATGEEERLVALPPVTTPVTDELPFAVFDGSVYVLEPPYRTGFETGFSTIVRVTPRP